MISPIHLASLRNGIQPCDARGARALGARTGRLTVRPILLAAGLIGALWAGCTFDTSRLDALTCQPGTQCPGGGLCIEGHCEPVGNPDQGELPGGDADMGDQSPPVDLEEPDDVAPDGEDPSPQDLQPGDVPPDLVEDPDLSYDIECEGPPNACGGCQPLPAVPGEPCEYQRCGVWVCSGPERVICVEGPINACGGCEPLDGSPGEECGCGGVYACAGTDALNCIGSELINPCGGCGGPDGEVGEACLCGPSVDEEHQWICEGDQLACRDGNNSLETAQVLAETGDDMDDWEGLVGSLVAGEVDDWYQIHVLDLGGSELHPMVALSEFAGTGRNHDLCAYWRYDSGRELVLWCEGGNSAELQGMVGCCSAKAGTEDEMIRLRNNLPYTNRLDETQGEDNDNGTLFIHVNGQAGEGCQTYHLQYRF
ncbi:MAG: hypothetical protein JW797_16640 [Bradymonadales bacterium]|nr:hypothetical protein [Bradymonadales bacterium]